jgi:uncharacterized lipoprotein YbaY
MSRNLKGTITCNTTNEIVEGAIAEIQVLDISLACGPSKTLGTQTIENPKTFPLNYSVNYDEPSDKHGRFSVAVRITHNDKLKFINDTTFTINDLQTGEFLDKKDLFVIAIQ